MVEENKLCNKEIHAYQNEDGTYKIEIITRHPDKEKYIGKQKFVDKIESKCEIERADIHITAYAIKDGKRLCSVTLKE